MKAIGVVSILVALRVLVLGVLLAQSTRRQRCSAATLPRRTVPVIWQRHLLDTKKGAG
jgi:hypothetical protein